DALRRLRDRVVDRPRGGLPAGPVAGVVGQFLGELDDEREVLAGHLQFRHGGPPSAAAPGRAGTAARSPDTPWQAVRTAAGRFPRPGAGAWSGTTGRTGR